MASYATMARLALLLLASAWLLSAATPVYLVLQKGASSLAYYSPDGKLLATVPTGKHPHEMVFSPDGRYLYTVDNGTMRMEHPGAGGNSLSIIDVKARKRVGEISLGDSRRPHGIDVDRKTGMLVVTSELPDRILLVDPQKRAVVKTWDTKGKTTHMVTLGPDSKWAYAGNSSSGDVSAINLSTGELKLIKTGDRTQGSALSKDGRELYVTSNEGITIIDTAAQQARAHIKTCAQPVRIAVAPSGDLVYACMGDKRVGFADPRTRTQTGYVLVPGPPVSLTLSRDGKLAFASAEDIDTVYVISVPDRKIVREIRTEKGAAPDPVLEYLE